MVKWSCAVWRVSSQSSTVSASEQSYLRPAQLLQGSGQNIQGMDEVVEGMAPAGKRRALIPPAVGYQPNPELLPQPPGFGARRQLLNHAGEPLVFEVQLLRVRQAA